MMIAAIPHFGIWTIVVGIIVLIVAWSFARDIDKRRPR
jgi:predicted PurR-regulated permease PerM